MNKHDQIALLTQRYCPFCKDEQGEKVALEPYKEIDQYRDGTAMYSCYWACPWCDKCEETIANDLGVRYSLCGQCAGYGTTGYDEWEENCDQCDGIGYTLSEPVQMA